MKVEKTRIKSYGEDIEIIGLTNEDKQELGHWYSYFTNRREDGNHHPGWGYMLGGPIVDDKAIKKGVMFLGNILHKLDEFNSKLKVESMPSKNNVVFKCQNAEGKRMVVVFSHGDLIDFPTTISLVDASDVKSASIMLDKGIILDKLSYYNARTDKLSDYYRKIYEDAYNNKESNKTR